MRWVPLCGSLSILWDWNENWHFPILWPLLSFPNLLIYWVQHFHSITFRIWNSSTGLSSPPLALFVVMLPKAHLTSHSKIRKLWYIYTMEYYSAIKKNTFESVLMTWLKLEPIIQSEVSQKNINKVILMHIYGIYKDGNDDPICKKAKETLI